MIPIIIINWNGIVDTIECIESIINSQWTDYHLHVIDNNSDHDEGLQIQNRYSANAHITTHLYDKNFGFTGAHNKIWNEVLSANHELTHVALINNDIFVPKESIFINDKSIAIVNLSCPIMMQYYNRELIDNCGLKLMSTGEILPAGHNYPKQNNFADGKIIGPSGGACLISTKLIHKFGFFDNFFETGYEDAEFALRATLSGFNTQLDTNSLIYHKGGQSIKKTYDHQTFIRTQRNILYTIFKLFPPISLFIVILILLFYYLGLIFTSTILLRWTYTSSFINALYLFILNDYSIAMTYRREFKAHRKLTSLDIIKMQHSSVKLAVKRLLRIFILRNKSKVDEY